MPDRDGYIPGVPCWIDTSQPDPEAAVAFYSGLFGWEFADVMPPDSEGKYFIGRLRGGDVAAVGSTPQGAPPMATWNTYIAVESADETAADVDDPTVDTQHVPTVNDIADLVAGYQHAVGSDEARNLRNPEPDKDRAPPKGTEQIYLINLNRPATQGLFESRSTVKGDASQRLFEIRTTGLHIAVVDGGIDSTHQAFLNRSHERYKQEEWPK